MPPISGNKPVSKPTKTTANPDPKKTDPKKKPGTPVAKTDSKESKSAIDPALIAAAIKATDKPADKPKPNPIEAQRKAQLEQIGQQFQGLVQRNKVLEGGLAQVAQEKQGQEAGPSANSGQAPAQKLPGGLDGSQVA